MLKSQSIRRKFLVQLFISSASLILIFSSLLYFYIKESIYDEKTNELIHYAQNISQQRSVYDIGEFPDNFLALSIELISLWATLEETEVYEKKENKKSYLTLIYPFDKNHHLYLKITKEITPTTKLLAKVLNYIFIINVAGFLIVIVYATTLSKILVKPVKRMSEDLSNMNEHLMHPIEMQEIPLEFLPLAQTINHLIARIQNFVKYQKELFIGTAHELKTPLAVIKLKNQVTLIKRRSAQEYIDAIQTTNKTIDEMDIIISNILNIGRQEGAQLDQPQEIDVVGFLKQKANDFKLLADNEGKTLEMEFHPDMFMATLQVSLLNQIVQNFLQNALKFTPRNKSVKLQTSQDDFGLLIEVLDEGCGIDETVDFFAPFKRQGNKSGVGLGLFLAKSAADALGAKITIENRKDGIEGTRAALQLNSQLSCIIPQKK
ncbi:MAG: HAMP domain-containing histidine kinase [Epsilonproteobacteria bacterium]|nr:HAMP domain-containing histidine kinase [Campylobacterota bacterium]